MKTNQVMTRTMGQFEVFQRTKDGMFNATTLLKQWNESSGQQKDVSHFFENKQTEDFINELILQKNFTSRNSVFIKSKASRGDSAGTWMHPLLFIDFAMWLNAKFKVQVLQFVYDQLLDFRNDAGDGYRGFTDAIQKFEDVEYFQVAIALNKIVFGKHEKDIRNRATAEELKELNLVQRKLAFACEMGYIKSFSELLSEMEKMANNQKLISKN